MAGTADAGGDGPARPAYHTIYLDVVRCVAYIEGVMRDRTQARKGDKHGRLLSHPLIAASECFDRSPLKGGPLVGIVREHDLDSGDGRGVGPAWARNPWSPVGGEERAIRADAPRRFVS